MVIHIGFGITLLKEMNKIIFAFIVGLAVIVGCSSSTEQIEMYPDYRDVVIPSNIAPLNFYYTGGKPVTKFCSKNIQFTIKGKDVIIPENKWKELINDARGSYINISSSLMGDWMIYVSMDTIDKYLTYRLLEPGFEVSNKVEIYERNISNFEYRLLSSYYNTSNSCMNCHIHKERNSIFYLRGQKGGAILSSKGKLRKLNLKNDKMFTGTVYGDLHSNGRWGVFSYNKVIPAFHTKGENRLEVYDSKSDICITDFDNNKILLPESLGHEDILETFPCFSADGQSIFYCAAEVHPLPQDVKKIKYSIYKTSFNPETGETGMSEVIWDAKEYGGSACHPKASPDGRWLLYTIADYGTFPIWHRECDLQIMNLLDGSLINLPNVNSDKSDTYHSWSSNSHWFVFASKRDDGQYGKPYFCHIDDNGNTSKAFLLPQKDPHHYDKTLKSYNIPDLGIYPAQFTVDDIGRMRNFSTAEKFE